MMLIGDDSQCYPSYRDIATARYVHLADDPVKAATEAVGRHIAAAMEGADSGEVVELPRSGRATIKDNQ